MKKKNLFSLKNIGIALLAFILLMVIARKAGWIGAEQGTKVSAENPEVRNITEVVSASGKIQPEISVKISPDVSGEIIELAVKEGQQVKKGDLLVRIQPDLYIANLKRVEASLNAAKANVANSKARMMQSKAQLINAEANYNRQKKVV
jgi:HlyD family secretion protein